MPTTSNFGWTTPADTDLVKDGAAAIRTLGNGIDTSMAELKGGTTGQILSKTSNTDMDFTWVTPNPGDITEVTVSSPITGGGTSGSVNIAIQDGTTAQKGAVQLTNSTSRTSTTTAATPNSVKTAYDLADAAIPKSLVDAKADLITATADNTPARLAVGSNGDTLFADSAATTGLRWQGNFAAGKNKFINGAFDIWQRGTSLGPTVSMNAYVADRWYITASGETVTYSQQTFTPGSAPVTGYESQYFARALVSSSAGASNRAQFLQRVEDVRTLADQTVTISYWAKADAAKSVSLELQQSFGSGGSAAVNTFIAKQALTTSWVRYSHTFAVPSVSGKTIGSGSFADFRFWLSAGSDFNSRTSSLGQQNITFDVWGIQLEAGNVATAFQTATGKLQGELAACQRYYYVAADATTLPIGLTSQYSATLAIGLVNFPVTMRTAPTLALVTGTSYYQLVQNGATTNYNSFSIQQTSKNATRFDVTTVGLTAGHSGYFITNNAAANVAFTAEL